MIILLSSPSGRLLNEKLAELTAAFVKKSGKGAEVERLTVTSDTSAKSLLSTLGANSLFATKRLVVVRGIFDLRAAESRDLVTTLKKRTIPTGTTLVLVASEPLPPATKQPLTAFLKKSATVKKMSVVEPSATAVPRELVGRAKERGVILSLPIARELCERVNSFDRALGELEKLCLYVSTTKKKAITSADIQAMVESTLESDVFAMIRAIASGQRRAALTLLHEQLASGAHPLYLLAMLRYQFRSFMLVAEAQRESANPREIQIATGLSPYVIRTVQGSLGRFTPERIRVTYSKLVDADEAIKTSAIDGDVALDLLVLALSA